MGSLTFFGLGDDLHFDCDSCNSWAHIWSPAIINFIMFLSASALCEVCANVPFTLSLLNSKQSWTVGVETCCKLKITVKIVKDILQIFIRLLSFPVLSVVNIYASWHDCTDIFISEEEWQPEWLSSSYNSQPPQNVCTIQILFTGVMPHCQMPLLTNCMFPEQLPQFCNRISRKCVVPSTFFRNSKHRTLVEPNN